jgi:membrane-bound lytic murein transglycosylase A
VLIATALVVLACAIAGAVWWYTRSAPEGVLALETTSFADLPGWEKSDARPALASLARSCTLLLERPSSELMTGSGYGGTVADWTPACRRIPNATAMQSARAWFEKNFVPFSVRAGSRRQALFTGYYEPELRGAHTRHGPYQSPVYGMPGDLVEADLGAFRASLKGEHIAGRLERNHLVPYSSRAEIDRYGLKSAAVLFYASDPVALFFLHIQGSGRVRFEDGSMRRVAYVAQNGWPYTPVGRILLDEGALDRNQMSLQGIRKWMHEHSAQARDAMERDQSYVFFKDAPVGDPALGSPGAEGVPLTPGASMAVDSRIHPLGAPVFVVASVPNVDAAKPENQLGSLFIAQDVGGAIRGALRGDLFFGYGDDAESMAGRMKANGQMYVLLPRELVARGLQT